jgi:glucosamine-6-phosphate deaminase
MEILVVKNYKELSAFAARLAIEQVNKKKSSVLGLATGNSMIGVYKELAKAYKAGEVSFKKVTTFNLDEFVDLPHYHMGTLFYFMRRHFFDKVDLNPENIYFLDSEGSDHVRECKDYEKALKAKGPIDLQFLGIGLNGHIGWDEPGTSFKSRTCVIDLSATSRKQQQGNFSSLAKVPKQGYSMGLGTIMEAKKLVLLASGKEKAGIIAKALRGPVTKDVPASIIKTHLTDHPDIMVILDRDAASELLNL